MDNVFGVGSASDPSVADRVTEVVNLHKKAVEAVSRLRTTKELKEAELNKLLQKYSSTYSEPITVSEIPAKLEEARAKKVEIENKIIKSCDDFKAKWEGGASNVN